MPYGNGSSVPGRRSARAAAPSQPVSTTARADASRAAAVGVHDEQVRHEAGEPGAARRAADRRRCDLRERARRWRPARRPGRSAAITADAAARQLVGDAPPGAVEHVGVGGVDDGQARAVGGGGHPRVQRTLGPAVGRQPLLAGAVRRGAADVRPAAVHAAGPPTAGDVSIHRTATAAAAAARRRREPMCPNIRAMEAASSRIVDAMRRSVAARGAAGRDLRPRGARGRRLARAAALLLRHQGEAARRGRPARRRHPHGRPRTARSRRRTRPTR